MRDYKFCLDFKVRDYECDMEGIVNNATYMNYLEHARHEFFHTLGIDFAEMTNRGVFMVVTKAELEYKASLKSGDVFKVCVDVERESKLRIAFIQDIYRSDGKLVLKGRVTGTAVNSKGRPELPAELEQAFGI
ncbi:thioesterase family protein [Seleniivibrio woodruffii]|uniref:acyl-CoA thioesterase n=1 Tax=Seleniivibrio woodruffii TaxID=1078050 RepID=UPI0026E9C0F1|nr:acyl-CoA thioesterase [Seleniivibrio woodruffii]